MKQKKVVVLLNDKNCIFAINPKSRNKDKKDLKVYYNKQNKIDVNIILKGLNKFPHHQEVAKVLKIRKKQNRNYMSELRATEDSERGEERKQQHRVHIKEVHATQDSKIRDENNQ